MNFMFTITDHIGFGAGFQQCLGSLFAAEKSGAANWSFVTRTRIV